MTEDEMEDAYSKSIAAVCSELNTNKHGLKEDEAQRRLEIYGPNEITTEKKKSSLYLFLHQFISPLNGILLIAAIISILARHLEDAYVIFGLIILNSIIGFLQEYKAENAIEKLKKMGAPEADVLRRTEQDKPIEFEIPSVQVVPGDIIILSQGDRVPADGRLITEMNLHVDESMLTGESVASSKNLDVLEEGTPIADHKNTVFAGTLIVQGRGKAIVTKTGMRTEMGKISTIMQQTKETDIPIKKNIASLTKIIGVIALLVSVSLFVVGTFRGIAPEETFLFAVASAVSSIPEGLPIVLTVTLAIAIGKMAKRNAIIRKMPAVETLGTISTIVSDKTGTLTTNQMTVRRIMTESHSISVSGSGYEPKGKFIEDDSKEEIEPLDFPEIKHLFEVMVLCNDAQLREHVDESGMQWQVHGGPTEGALVVAAMKGDLEKQDYEISHPRVDEIGFDSEHKYMATFHEIEGDSKILACVKGAPEKILSMCSSIQVGAGESTPLTPEKIAEIEAKASSLANQAYRVLAFAYLNTGDMDHDRLKSAIPEERKLVFLGLAGIIDPPRPEAKRAILLCRSAGIRVFMATGDHKLTALAISKELGLSEDDDLQGIEGVDLETMSDEELEHALETVRVFSRVTPEHKHRVVGALQKLGYIVAVTGDGINDAPAIKASDVGIAMGISGTDVTKEAADMVLVDDNFASIVNAVEEGRIVYENIKKVVKYLIATNIGEDFIIILAFLLFPLFLDIKDPNELLIFTTIQILWVNLVTDGVLDITLAMEPKEDDVMRNKPRNPDAKILDKEILKNTIYVAGCMAIGVLTVYVVYIGMEGENATIKAKTMAFVLLSMFQVFNALNCRSRTHSVFKLGFFKNKWLLGAIAFSVTLQFLTTVLPPLQVILNTVPLDPIDWLVIMLVSSSVWVVDEVRKFLQKKLTR